MEQIKELRSDENDALFDRTNMFFKEFPSDFRQIRYFTLLIVQSAPLEIKEINLLEQQISEVIKNAVKHGHDCDINKKVRVWYSFSPTHAHLIVEDDGERLAQAIGVETDRISVKATTTEHMGFEGEERGISAHAVCLLEKS